MSFKELKHESTFNILMMQLVIKKQQLARFSEQIYDWIRKIKINFLMQDKNTKNK